MANLVYKRTRVHQWALNLLSITVFLLLAFPRMNIKIGPIPFYVMDGFLFLTFAFSTQLPKVRSNNLFNYFFGIILFFLIFSETFGALNSTTFLEPFYLIMRGILAFSLLISIQRTIVYTEDLDQVLKFAAVGALITGLLLILSSLPQTKSFVRTVLFGINFLEPASEEIVANAGRWVGAERGQSYVGTSILSGAFINSVFPLILLIRQSFRQNKRWSRFLFVASIILPFSVIFSYSRGAIIGVVFVFLGILLFNAGNYRKYMLLSIFLGIMAFVWVGLESEYFYFKRVQQSTERIVDKPIEDRNETERLYAYVEPFWHLAENPQYLILGEGFYAPQKAASRAIFADNRADHAVFAKAYYSYGLIAALVYVIMLLYGLNYTLISILRSRNKQTVLFARVIFASLMGFIPWFVLGHAAVSQPRGAAMLTFIFALVAIQRTLESKERLIFKEKLQEKLADA